MAFLIPIIPVGTRPQRTPRAKPPSQVLSLTQPQQTLYVRNLTEEHSTEQVHASLTSLFSQHGSLLGVKAKRNIRHRGQAFVSFDSVDAATRAMHALQGYFLFEKPMVSLLIQDIQYAREPAFAVSETNGTLDDHNRMRVESKPSREKPLVKKPKRSNLSKPVTLEDHLPPNSILFVQNLPPGTKEAAIIAMFQQYYFLI